MEKKYDSFLFDLDGTLIDTKDLILNCFKHSLSTVGVVKSDSDITDNIGLPLREQFELYLEDKSVDVENLMAIHMNYQLGVWQQYLKLLPNVKVILNSLVNKKCAIVTSRKIKTAKLYTEYLGIADYFEVFITPESTLRHKPHPEPVLKAMEQISAIPKKTLFVGDSVFDILAGQSANIDTYLVKWNSVESNSDVQIQPTYRKNNLESILDLF